MFPGCIRTLESQGNLRGKNQLFGFLFLKHQVPFDSAHDYLTKTKRNVNFNGLKMT